MGGLLGQVLGGLVGGNLGRRGRRGGSPIVNGLLVALAVKAAQHYMSQRSGERTFQPGQAQAPESPGGLGGLLGGLGGAGALGALLGQLREKGFGDIVDSWVGTGPNRPLPPSQLAEALGDENVQALAEETGMEPQALMSELAEALPEAVDELTPAGREPTDADLGHFAGHA